VKEFRIGVLVRSLNAGSFLLNQRSMMLTRITSTGRWPAPGRRGPALGLFVLVPFLQLFVAGCESRDGVVDSGGTPPQILAITASPDVFVLDTIGGNSGTATLQTLVRATVRNPSGGAPGSPLVTASVTAPGSDAPLVTVSLKEESNASGIRTYSATLQFQVARSAIGSLPLSVASEGPDGLPGNSIIRQILLRRSNARPVLSDLVAPDTVDLSPGGSLLIPMTITATDSNGADDIREVYFRSLDSSDPTRKFFLYDNGDPANGDSRPGDGVYSIVIRLTDSPTVRRTFRFAFQAADGAGDTSLTTLHRMTVR
jgi:hypothetical protein